MPGSSHGGRRVMDPAEPGSGRPVRGAPPALPSILLVDDHPIWRESLRRLLERKRAGRVVAEAADGDEALALARRETPDIVIMDLDLPTIDGVETTRRIHAELPGARVLFLSALQGRDGVLAAVRAGASAYLLKTAASSDVVDAVQRVHAGELVFPPSLSGIVLEELRRVDGRADHERRASSAARDRIRDERASGDPGALENAFVREGEFWTLAYNGELARMKDSKGLRYIADLLRSPGRGIHVMELVAAEEGVQPARTKAAPQGAYLDSVPAQGILDAKAKSAYRARLEDLREQAEEAESWGDTERAGRAKEEIEVLAGELARAMGLGGRDRTMASASERARINVSRAISSSVARIQRVHPALARHLASVKTGTFCSYEPEEPTPWRL